MSVSGEGWLRLVGPIPNAESSRYDLYNWASDSALALQSESSIGERNVAGFVNLRTGVSQVARAGHSQALSPDGSRLVYADRGYLVLRELGSDGEKRMAVGKDPDTSTGFFDLLSWAPDSRRLLGTFSEFDGESLVDSLWSLDVEVWRLQVLRAIPRHGYGLLAWSDDGSRAVVREYLEAHTECPTHQVLEVDLAKGSAEVIVPQTDSPVAYHVTWLPDGRAKAEPVIPGPRGAALAIYDPTLKLYAYQLDGPEPFLGTELRLLDTDGAVQFAVDMAPGLKDAGVPLGQIETLVLSPEWSADSRYALLEGYVLTSVVPRRPAGIVRGVFDAASRSLRFLPFEAGENEPPSGFFLYEGERWSGEHALLVSGDAKRLAALNMADSKVTTLVKTAELIYARWVGDRALYVGATEIGLVGLDGAKQVLATASPGERFASLILRSPGGGLLAVPRLSQNPSGLTSVALHILDLSLLPGD